MTPTQSRARKLERVLVTYDPQDEPLRTLVTLLADARHWCDRHGQDYSQLDRRGYLRYLHLLRRGASTADDLGGAV